MFNKTKVQIFREGHKHLKKSYGPLKMYVLSLKRKPRLSQKLITILTNNYFDSLKNIHCASKFEIKN